VVTEATAKSHINHLLAKIDAWDRAHAVMYARTATASSTHNVGTPALAHDRHLHAPGRPGRRSAPASTRSTSRSVAVRAHRGQIRRIAVARSPSQSCSTALST